MLLALWLLWCVGYVSCKTIKFDSCGGNVTAVRVTPCEEEPCKAIKGKSIHIEADFISKQNSDWLQLWVGAEISGISLPLPGLNRDACKGRNITCPVSEGDKQTFVFDLDILPFFPSLKTMTVFEITGEGDKLLCFKAPVQIVTGQK
ncbi:mite group 2 allergen-like Ixo r 2 [Centruroides vittatus]|uniref:mite group 2 allergen-like Ixo r 2 n=1 Tax=Centruroides vittatus TaxID=120091 RepID=UPI00350F7EA8